MRLVIFINNAADHALYIPDAIVAGSIIRGTVENGLYSVVIEDKKQGVITLSDEKGALHTFQTMKVIPVPPEIHGNYNHIIDWAIEQLRFTQPL